MGMRLRGPLLSAIVAAIRVGMGLVATMSADVVLLDRLLAHYGPEAKARAALRATVIGSF